jgi:threonyl-tRNA synthetase
VIYALLELAAIKQRNGQTPKLPLWLSPTQVRFVPVSDKHVDQCVKFAQDMAQKGIRADVDDGEVSMDKKIRNAEQDWIPYICVIGDKEIQSGLIAIRTRGIKTKEESTLSKLAERIANETEGMPKASLPMAVLVSKRPTFVG